jgi:hypothetical protein
MGENGFARSHCGRDNVVELRVVERPVYNCWDRSWLFF